MISHSSAAARFAKPTIAYEASDYRACDATVEFEFVGYLPVGEALWMATQERLHTVEEHICSPREISSFFKVGDGFIEPFTKGWSIKILHALYALEIRSESERSCLVYVGTNRTVPPGEITTGGFDQNPAPSPALV